MRVWAVGMVGLAALLCVSCGGVSKPAVFAPGLSVQQTDVRIGLTADDNFGGEAVLEGVGFERLSSSSYVTLIEDGGGAGALKDGGHALARGEARSSVDLEGYVFAKTNDGGQQSAAQVVQLTTTVLQSTERVEKVRVEIDTEMEVSLSGGAIAICEVAGEATLDGHPMAEVKTKLYLYPRDGGIEIFLGPRSPEKSPFGTMENGATFKTKDPSFYFGLGPGVYQLLFTFKLSVACPGDRPDSAGSIRTSSSIGIR